MNTSYQLSSFSSTIMSKIKMKFICVVKTQCFPYSGSGVGLFIFYIIEVFTKFILIFSFIFLPDWMAERETVQFQRWPPQIDLWPIPPAEPVMLHQSRNPSLQLSHQVRLGSPASRGRHLSPPSVWPQVMWLGATRRCWRRKGGHRMSVNHSVLLVKLMRFCVTQVITIFSQFFFCPLQRAHTKSALIALCRQE